MNSMSESLRIRQARPKESGSLSDLALRSKAVWGYSQEFLERCRAELSVDADRIGSVDYQCFVAVKDESIVGFYTLEALGEGESELGALFVEPEFIGRGLGRRLLEHAMQRLSRFGVARLTIQGDPHAKKFYLAAGARQVALRESGSIPGRYLPVFEIDVTPLLRTARGREH